jgi:VCBS repeat-containing protein
VVLTYTVQTDDGNGGTASQDVTITVHGTEDVPVITAQDLVGAVTEQVTPAGNLTDSGIITFSDADFSDVHLVSATGTPIGTTLGSLTAIKNSDTTGTGTGGQLTWTYTVADSAVEYLAKDQTKVESFTITLDDQNGGLITKQIDVTITGTNDAPVLDATKTPVLNAENQGVGTPVNGTAVGTLVSSLVSLSGGVANVTDVDNGAVTGIALTGTDTSHGTWYYTIDGGAHWAAVGSVSNTSALLLAADGNTRLYFQPSAGYSGTDTNAITFHAWDQTSGSNGASGVDASINGGSTAFSTATDTANITINATDIAPVVDLNGPGSGNNNTLSYAHGVTSPIPIAPSATITDPDSPNMASMTITLTNPQDNSSGTGGVNIKEILSLTAAAQLLATTDGLTVTFTANGNNPETLVIQGTASKAHYQTILEGVQYADSKTGNHSNATRIVDVVVNDGTLNSAVQTVTINVAAPAGVAGAPINLALADPSPNHVGPVTLTIAGVPEGWSLSEGTTNSDGTWTVQTNDIAALSITSTPGYTGALVLNVTEGWTNADGSTGYAIVADNVEVFAKGAPIFALSGDDTLTGSSGNDLFVFAQPIGNDTLYNFNVATDKIDLMGFANIVSFHDVQTNMANDINGNAVITFGNGETITLHGVDAASLTADDFVFNQTPVIENAGTMVVSDGAILPLSGTIDNSGTIALDSSGTITELQIVGDGITLEGSGHLALSNSQANVVFGTTSASTLTNVDNTISGVGQIGIGDGTLTLVNEAHGTIEANISGGTLTLDTGHTIINDGILEATNGGTLQVGDAVSGGSAIIAGGTLIFNAQSDVNVTFDNGTGTPAYGELVVEHASEFAGQISGFTGTAPDTAHSDAIDLKDIAFDSNMTFTYDDNSGTDTGGTLTISESGNIIDSLTFANGEYITESFNLSSDGSGGTLITDPPTSTATTAAATPSSFDGTDALSRGLSGNNIITSGGNGDALIGGDGHDTFVFNAIANSQEGVPHFDSISNFTHNSDHIDLAAIDGLNTNIQGVNFNSLTSAPENIAAHTIDIVTSDGNTVIYANSSGASETLANANMEIHLPSVTNATSSDFILHH